MSAQPKRRRVTQETLGEIMRLKTLLASARDDVRRIQETLGSYETAVIDLLSKGAIPERGPFTAYLQQITTRRPHWKALYCDVEGPAGVARAINAAPPTTVTKLIVDAEGE